MAGSGSYIGVTPGSGAKISTGPTYTENANIVQDQKVIAGEPYLATYSLIAGPSLATLNSHLIQIMAGASLNVRIRRVEFYFNTVATTATLDAFALVRLSTAGTGGSVVTPAPFNPADPASGATGMTLPTVKGTEGVTTWQGNFVVVQTLPAGGTFGPQLVWDFEQRYTESPMIPAGAANGFAIKNLVAVATTPSVAIIVKYQEMSF